MNKYKSIAMALVMTMALASCGNTATKTKEGIKEEVKQDEVKQEETTEIGRASCRERV